jgi:DNA (cytosine-5)-methyltransferase 1
MLVANAVLASAGSSPRGDGSDNLVCAAVAASLTGGGHPGSAIPGRHQEDDVNLVATKRAFIVNAEGSTAKESHARETDRARCLDTTGGYASGQGGTVVVAFDPTQLTHKENRSKCEPGAPAPSLAARARPPHVAYSIVPEGGQGSDLRASQVEVAPALTATGEKAKTERGTRVVQELADGHGWTVRRLTPRECERLQGLPDDWTLVDGASDSARYEAIGNGVAVPVLAWIGRRLAEGAR